MSLKVSGLIFIAGVALACANTPGKSGAAGSPGSTGAAGQAGSTGATGAVGRTGSTGAAGQTGSTGVTGQTGPTGQIMTFGYFYALMPSDNTATVAAGSAVAFPQTGPTNGIGSRSNASAPPISICRTSGRTKSSGG